MCASVGMVNERVRCAPHDAILYSAARASSEVACRGSGCVLGAASDSHTLVYGVWARLDVHSSHKRADCKVRFG